MVILVFLGIWGEEIGSRDNNLRIKGFLGNFVKNSC